ncbi:YhfC family intramembrane metalloprotease [Sporolactobacillus shoreae]|uniref:YhfC family intramembrane metalloprotease n=1 Tax=Sporolactobacillus shoreae TaxID=1465501 RepID=A0A4Z0GHU0_9BACL|nr:YhfC family glutamic-type intramembrane protease [Sporolactobacillus shoreae]TGA96355.1 YhfC family intramembrane metalloprotease [Sporolactobacillus shoreae]
MVSGWSILGMFVTMLVPIGVFIGLLIFFLIRYKVGMKPILIGAGIFLVFALVLEGLLNRFLLKWDSATATFFKNQLALAVYGALTASIFEEVGRLIGFKFLLKKKREWKHGVAYGLGHGGLEVIFVGGMLALAQINNVILSFMINNGTLGTLQKTLERIPTQADILKHTRQQLVNLPSWAFFMGGLERVDALLIQIALSVLVLYAVIQRRYIVFLLAIFLHAAVDFTGPFCKLVGVSLLPTEGIITLYAVASAGFVILHQNGLMKVH